MKRKALLLCLVFMCIFFTIACGNRNGTIGIIAKKDENNDASITVVDLLGREVRIPKDAERFVNVGVGCLRLYSYLGPLENLVGVEENEKEDKTGVPYSIINSDIFMDLPTIGMGGSKNGVDPEQIINVKPDVIFNTYARDIDEADELQAKTKIPVVVLSYGELAVFDDKLYESISLIGKVTREEGRAEELVDLLKGYYDDLTARSKDIKDPPRVYIGGLGSKGVQGIESTRGNYMIFNVLNAKNLVDETGITGSVKIDIEQLLNWDPEYIFIDLEGYQLVLEDYKKNHRLFDNLSAVKENKVYSQFPYNKLTTNIETAIVNAYYMGTVLYKEEFSDIDIEKKADEIYINLLGKPFYKKMLDDYQELGVLKIKEL